MPIQKILNCERDSRCFQQGGGPSGGLLRALWNTATSRWHLILCMAGLGAGCSGLASTPTRRRPWAASTGSADISSRQPSLWSTSSTGSSTSVYCNHLGQKPKIIIVLYISFRFPFISVIYWRVPKSWSRFMLVWQVTCLECVWPPGCRVMHRLPRVTFRPGQCSVLQVCSAAVLQWAHGHGCRVMGHRGQCDCKAINCLHTSTQTFLHTKYAYKASWESSLIFRHVSVLEYLQNCQTSNKTS